jgi:hypothetical protein
MVNLFVAPERGEMDEAYGLLNRSAVRPGNAGDGDRKTRMRMGERASSHGSRNIFAYGSVPLDQPEWYAEHLTFRCIRVGDEPALEYIG